MQNQDNNIITEFWMNKEHFNKAELKDKALMYYTEEFIENYERWKDNLDNLNETAKQIFADFGYSNDFWVDIKYNDFVKNVNELLSHIIDTTGDIFPEDMVDITTSIVNDHLLYLENIANQNKFTVSSILNSIKTQINSPEPDNDITVLDLINKLKNYDIS